MAKVITITYDEQRDAIAHGFSPDLPHPGLLRGESAKVVGGMWMVIIHGDEHPTSKRMSDALDCLLGFMERTKDT